VIADQRKMKKPCRYCGSLVRYESYQGESWMREGVDGTIRRNLLAYLEAHPVPWPYCCTTCVALEQEDACETIRMKWKKTMVRK